MRLPGIHRQRAACGELYGASGGGRGVGRGLVGRISIVYIQPVAAIKADQQKQQQQYVAIAGR